MPELVVLHTNDMHNRLDEAAAAVLRNRREATGALLLDAGDAAWAGNMYYRPGGEQVLETMSSAGYDAMTVGNREFHFTNAGFASKLSRATFTCLCANIRATRDAALPCVPSVIFERAGLRIGVFGVTVPMVTPRMRTAAFSAFVFDDPIDAAREIAGSLRPECDLLVALTHIGLKQDRKLAAAVPQVDLIVGGHSHDVLHAPHNEGGVCVAQAGSHGRYYGVLEITRSGGRWSAEGRLETLRGARA